MLRPQKHFFVEFAFANEAALIEEDLFPRGRLVQLSGFLRLEFQSQLVAAVENRALQVVSTRTSRCTTNRGSVVSRFLRDRGRIRDKFYALSVALRKLSAPRDCECDAR